MEAPGDGYQWEDPQANSSMSTRLTCSRNPEKIFSDGSSSTITI